MTIMASRLSSAGPFVSGTLHRLLTQGQLPDSSAPAAVLPPPVLIPAAAAPPASISPTASAGQKPTASGQKRKPRVTASERQASEEASDLLSPAGPTTSTKSKGTGGSPTLSDMLHAGVLQPGLDNATVTYKGVTYSASLQANGTILFNGQEFSTPSAFSVYVKRLVTPNKQGDDGWHSVSINGTMLHTLRLQYQQMQQQGGTSLPPLPAPKRQAGSSKGQKHKQQQQQGSSQSPALGQQQQQQHSRPLSLHLHIKQAGRPPQQPQRQQQPSQQQPSQQQQRQPQQQQQQQSQPHQPIKKLKLGKVKMPPPDANRAAAAGAAFTLAGSKGPAAKPTTAAGAAAGAPQGALRWVQCSRCEVWRSVPQSCWAQLDADKRKEFFCEDAWWDVSKMEPFTPGCLSEAAAGL